MKVTVKRIILLLTIFTLCLSSTPVSLAADDRYKTFSQLDPEWASKPYHAGGTTIGKAGCYITSFACLMAYANPDLRDSSVFNPYTLSQKMQFTSGGGAYQATISNADPTFTWECFADPGSDVCATIKSFLDQGKFVVVRAGPPIASSSTHFSPIVGWDDATNKPKIMDVAGGHHPEWSQWEPYVDRLDVCSSSISSSKDVLNGTDTVQDNAPETEEEKQELDELIKEWDLVGMPDNSHLGEFLTPIELKERDSLDTKEISLVDSMKEDIESHKEQKTTNWYQVAASFLGIVSLFYGLLLFLAYLFDYINVFVEISVLGLISFGKFKVMDESDRVNGVDGGYNKKDGYTYLTKSMIAWRVAICVIVGLILVSGVLFDAIFGVFNWVTGLLNK